MSDEFELDYDELAKQLSYHQGLVGADSAPAGEQRDGMRSLRWLTALRIPR